MDTLGLTELESPLGRLTLAVAGGRLYGLSFPGRWAGVRPALARRFGRLRFDPVDDAGEPCLRLAAYFEGDLQALGRIPVDPGGTPFQQEVWSALQRIAVGRTLSYTELAQRVGRPTASRAVATANAQNPIAVVIPCHRVIHAGGSISGYGGGVERKRWLLRHEGALLC